ncbi:ABC transporter substrate-binding protein [Nonomuraea sp. LPB2021202275-12-8]|uniref:ABC transporter substrate-binding protein n=1 Tax=Nonomuraea sp. LPB2021202275-12-8 TaxID=3120159 RepID=UPI00300C999C
MADLRGVIEGLVRRPAFWRADPPLPTVLVMGPEAFQAIEMLAKPFQDCVPYADVRDGAHGSVLELVKALAGEHGQLGKPVGGSLLPPPRFPLAQFVVWAREQRDLPPEGGGTWPPDPQTHTGYREFKKRFKEWRKSRFAGYRNLKVSIDLVGRALVTWLPIGALAVYFLGGVTDFVGAVPLVGGGLLALVGAGWQGWRSIRGSLTFRWFGEQPYLTRKRFERKPQYALRLAGASEADIERLLVHALARDLREAYKKWITPWPSWGRGLYALLLLQAGTPDGVNARFLRLMEETTRETGLLVPMVVLAAVADVEARPQAGPAELDELAEAVRRWRAGARQRVPDLRLGVRAEAVPAAAPGDRPLSPLRGRAVGYWLVVAALVVLPMSWVAWNQWDRAAHCGGLRWAERIGAECVGVVNATREAPEDLFGEEVRRLVQKIDANNAYAIDSGRYVSVVVFGEFSIRKTAADDTRLAAALSELAAVEQYQRDVSSTPRLRVLLANAGNNFAHGRRTARLITEMAEQDPHVMGVVGLARSVTGVSEAVGELHLAKIPMVSSTATADGLGYIHDPAKPDDPGDPSPYYFHVGPTNFREAALGSRFVEQRLLANVSKPSAVIVQDGSPSDQYTNNLADDFQAVLADRGIRVEDRVYYTVEAGGISSAAVKSCRLKPDVIVYAGRASEFRDFLMALEGNACGEVKVIAGDDVVKVVSDHGGEIAAMKQVEVYYLALAHRTLWRESSAEPTRFVSGLLKGAHKTASDDSLILTYDAINVIYQAANTAYRAVGAGEAGALPSRGDILYRLARTAGDAAWEGSGGVIDFSASERHTPTDKAIAIMKVDEAAWGHAKPVVRCGLLDTGEAPGKDALCAKLPDAASPEPRRVR